MTLHLRLAVGALLLVTSAGSRSAEPSAETGEAAHWELKGIHLGASASDVQAQLPNATCTPKPQDPGIVFCSDPKNTFGGETALVAVSLLDGEVVKVSIENLTYEQAYSACAPLVGKFGPASEMSKVFTKLQRGRMVEMQNKERCVWKDGEKTLYLEPADWTSKKKMFTYSAIILLDELRHNREWVVRYNANGTPNDL